METVDDFCRREKVQRIDLLKLDIQGWEIEVLGGCEAMLGRDAIHFVFAEVRFERLNTHIQQFSELHEFMEGNRFNFCGLYETCRYGAAGQFVWFANILSVNTPFTRSNRL